MRRLLGLGVLALALVACKRKDESRGTIDLSSKDAAETADASRAVADASAARALTALQIVAAGDASCALLSDHTVRCWKGTGPVTQPDVRAVTQLAMASDRVCALLDDKSVTCWGADEPHPTGILGVTNVARVFVLEGRACAAIATGSLVCWGNLDAAGRFSTAAKRRPTTPFAGLDHVAMLLPTAALREDGTVWSWGADGVPRQRGLEHVVELATTRDGAICGRLETGAVACVGATLPCAPKAEVAPPPVKPAAKDKLKAKSKAGKPPAKGKPKAGKPPAKGKPAKPTAGPAAKPSAPPVTAVAPAVPVEPVLVLDLPRAQALAFAVGLCVVTPAGKLQCGDGCGKLEAPWKLDRIEQVAGWCARGGGRVACWTEPRRARPIADLDDATALAVGVDHACALRADGSVVCWARGSTAATAVAW